MPYRQMITDAQRSALLRAFPAPYTSPCWTFHYLAKALTEKHPVFRRQNLCWAVEYLDTIRRAIESGENIPAISSGEQSGAVYAAFSDNDECNAAWFLFRHLAHALASHDIGAMRAINFRIALLHLKTIVEQFASPD